MNVKEITMPIWKTLALAGAILAGGIGLAGGASASPLASGAMPAVQADGLVAKAWHYGRPHYGYGPRYRPYRPYRAYRYRAYPYRGYARPRVVCRTVVQTVRRPSGRLVTRPVQRCFRRY
jgi:hypothetical protein